MNKGIKKGKKIDEKKEFLTLDQLKNELWSLRTGCKRIAREILLVYYPELSPNTEKLLEWARNNQTVLPSGTKRDREELLVPYRKAMIADLTGVEGPGQKQKAKFIYDLNRVCAEMFLLLPVVIDLTLLRKLDGRRPEPYSHPVLQEVIIKAIYLGNGLHRGGGLVEACSQRLDDNESFNPTPLPVLALATTAVLCRFLSCSSCRCTDSDRIAMTGVLHPEGMAERQA